MAKRKSFILYLLLAILIPAIMYYVLGMVILGYGLFESYESNKALGVCFLSLLSGPAIFYGIYWVRNKLLAKDIEFGDLDKDRSTESYPAEKQSKKRKKSGILNIFSSENKCENCGTEMEYKEAMDSYYCPQCREYK